jgi:hypothetical protein
MQKEEGKILAMYDVRGIQKYIYRTDKVRDAIGASYIVENIISDALENAAEKLHLSKEQFQMKWHDENGPLPFEEKNLDVQILFIGGGNAYVLYRDRDLCIRMNRLMSKYVMDKTYSLQLAVAVCEKTDNYAADYKNIQSRMIENKADMVVTKPLGALPIMKAELKTGFPAVLTDKKSGHNIGEETKLKQEAYKEKYKKEQLKREEQLHDNLVMQKGEDSNLAVVHIDGNSMGLRIRQLIEGVNEYKEAVDKMRQISYQIMYSYKDTFRSMYEHFSKKALHGKKDKYWIREILVAGDDITYVCNAHIALATVEYFSKHIAGKAMVRETDSDSLKKYGFSVCAGVAFIGSHFPFHIGYEVAEQCCDSAKKRAKSAECRDEFSYFDKSKNRNITMERIGNFVDFQICKNIQTQNFTEMRQRDYITRSGEELLIRPYFISVSENKEDEPLEKNRERIYAYQNFKEGIQYFTEGADAFPRSFSKQLRNTYPMGESQVLLLQSFLESRGWEMPNKDEELYYTQGEKKIAKWYDVLEMLDYCADLSQEKEENEL